MKIFSAIAVVLLLGLPVVASAQEVATYLADESDAAVRVEITDLSIPLPPQTFWQKLQSLLGTRKVSRYKPEIGTTFTVSSSAYASSPYQTDSTPCVTAVGTRVRPGVAASNFLPIGTVLESNGLKFIVEDRMNARYQGYFLDLWFPSTSEALEFGRQKLVVTVVGYADPGTDVRKSVPENVEIREPEEITLWNTVKEGVTTITSFISARVNPDVNRYDVDCLAEEE